MTIHKNRGKCYILVEVVTVSKNIQLDEIEYGNIRKLYKNAVKKQEVVYHSTQLLKRTILKMPLFNSRTTLVIEKNV